MKIYDMVYGVAHSYFQKVWGKNEEMIDFNVSLGLSVSLWSFIGCIALILELLGIDLIMPVFTQELYIVILSAAILVFHHLKFDYKRKSRQIVKELEESRGLIDNFRLKSMMIYFYLFGSPIGLALLGLILTFKNQ